MKLRSVLGILCFVLVTNVMADNGHTPRNVNGNQKTVNQNSKTSSGNLSCPRIYIYNQTGRDMVASGVVNSDYEVDPFYVYGDTYIDLYSDGYCFYSMQNINLMVPPYLSVNTGYIPGGRTVVGYIDNYNHLQFYTY